MAQASKGATISRGDGDYEKLRTRYFNARVPSIYPAEIACPTTTADVVDAVNRAKSSGRLVGVRSGGHLFPCSSLLEDGLLIDAKNLNSIDYDSGTKVLSFGPGCTSRELAAACTKINRFFPFGHSPTVGVGGFLLCGGQGWFMRGWGISSDSWVLKLEVVTADGVVVEASREKNQDLFWAARGSGQGFFGVVTRIWGLTIPARKTYEKTLLFNSTNHFEPLCTWLFNTNDKTPKYGVETAAVTMYADKTVRPLGDEIKDDTLLFGISLIAYADSAAEANTVLSAYEDIPSELKKLLIVENLLTEKTWEELFVEQDSLNPTGGAERWQCDSILNDPKIPRDQLVRTIKPAMCDLPSRRSVGCIYIGDWYPSGEELASSLPQQYYISTMTCWTNPDWDVKMRKWMFDQYTKASTVGCGQYIADFDVTHRREKVMTDKALKKWLKIRARWDPAGRFPGYKNFADTLSLSANI